MSVPAKPNISSLRRSIFFWSSLIACYGCFSQSQKDTTEYYAGYTSTGSFNKTNSSSSYLLNNGIKLGMKRKDVILNSNNKWLYGQQNNVLTNNDFTSSWDVNLYKTFPHFYYWGLFNYNSIYSLKVNNQLQAGLGVAYNIIDKKPSQLNISDGIIYDYSDIILSDSSREVYGTPRNSLRLQAKWNIKNVLTFNGNGFLQNSLLYKDDYIIKSDITMAFKIRKWLSLTTTFSYNKMSRTKRENLFFTYGLTIEKHF